MKKIALLSSVLLTLGLLSCSKCYDCTRQVEITDGNGNVIDTSEQSEEVCTADDNEIDNKEADGYDCS